MDDLCKVGGAGAIQLSAGSKWVTKHGYANRVEHGSKPAYACTFSTSAKLVSTPTLADDSPAMTATAPASGIGLVYAMGRCPLGHFFCKEKRTNRFPGTPRRKQNSERVEKRWFPDGFPEQPEILTGSALSPEQSRWKRAEQWTPQRCPPNIPYRTVGSPHPSCRAAFVAPLTPPTPVPILAGSAPTLIEFRPYPCWPKYLPMLVQLPTHFGSKPYFALGTPRASDSKRWRTTARLTGSRWGHLPLQNREAATQKKRDPKFPKIVKNLPVAGTTL